MNPRRSTCFNHCGTDLAIQEGKNERKKIRKKERQIGMKESQERNVGRKDRWQRKIDTKEGRREGRKV